MKPKNFLIIKRIEELATVVFFCASIFVLFFLTQTLFLTWLHQFKAEYIIICFFTSLVSAVVFFRFIKNDMRMIPHLNIGVILVILLIFILIVFFPHDSLGGGDEGAYSGLAIILAKHQGLSIPSYLYKTPLLYGSPDQTLDLTKPTYVVWLAVQKLFFGTEWMLRSNVVLISLGLSSLFLVSSLIIKKSLAFVTVLLFSTCMPFLWFMRETMTENMAFFLLWFLILSLFLFITTKKKYFLVNMFLSNWLLSFTRNEGLYMQIPILFVFVIGLLIKRTIHKSTIVLISIFYILQIILSFVINNNILPINRNINVTDTLINLTRQMEKSDLVRLGDKFPDFVFRMLSKLNLSLVLYLFPLVVILIFISKREVIKDKMLYIFLLGIISLELLKLINPSVTVTQPWMYRRYLYALLPFGYLSLSILLNKFTRKKLLVLLSFGFLILNVVFSSRIVSLKNNWSITEKMEKLTQHISQNDFVIIDGIVLGNYSPTTYIAYHKEVRNLYNWWIEAGDWVPERKTYQGIPYSRLFLISDKEDKRYPNFILSKINTVEIYFRQLQPNCDLTLLRNELRLRTTNMARLPYIDVINYCGKTDNDILDVKKKIVLYEMEYNGNQL